MRERGRIMRVNTHDPGPTAPSNYPVRPMTLDELAEWLDVSRRFLEGQVGSGRLRVRRISPRCVRVLPADIAPLARSSRDAGDCMNRAAPPGKEKPPARPSNREQSERSNYTAFISHRRGLGNRQYSQLLIERWASGLLPWFTCHRCGAPSLDPCGRDGKGQWLCLGVRPMTAAVNKLRAGPSSKLTNFQPTLVIDNREQTPLVFTRLQSVRGTLTTGDYSAVGLEELFSIELAREVLLNSARLERAGKEVVKP